jgi:hypothetical protein
MSQGARYNGAVPVTPSDTAHFSPRLSALYVGGAGNVTFEDAHGNVATITAPPVGTILPIAMSAVHATLTTATNLVGLF